MKKMTPLKISQMYEKLLRRRQILFEANKNLRQMSLPEFSEELEDRTEFYEALDEDVCELRDVDDAIARLDNGHYGKCEECKKDISWSRLNAIPEVRYCLACETKIERMVGVKEEQGYSRESS